MAAKRKKPTEPVTVAEVCQAVKETLATAFGARPLDPSVARRWLAHAAFDLIEMQLQEVAAQATNGRAAGGAAGGARPGAAAQASRCRPRAGSWCSRREGQAMSDAGDDDGDDGGQMPIDWR